MSTTARGLGRGLGALIPSPGASAEQSFGRRQDIPGNIIEIRVIDIIPNPRQPRMHMDSDALEELAASIREYGLLQPLIVSRTAPESAKPYQLIAGERRWRAAQLAGLELVPAVLKEAAPQELLELALVENIQRADLAPLEEAEAYQSLVAEFGLSQNQVAERVGRSRVTVANVLRLLQLPDKVKSLLVQGSLTEGHARALLGLQNEHEITKAAEQVIARELTVRQTEELVRRLLAATKAVSLAPDKTAEMADESVMQQTRRLEEAFRAALGTKVALSRSKRGGKLVISFYSDEELQTIYDRIIGAH